MIEITLTAVLALVLGLLPGLPAEWMYATVVGVSRHETDWWRWLRMLGFSIGGLILYSLAARHFHWPMAGYLVPDTFRAVHFTPVIIPRLGLAYIGHTIGAAVAGVAIAAIHQGRRKVVARSYVRDAWDHFVNNNVPRHWVIVRTTGGDSYLGIIEDADVAVEPEYRDIVLEEPASFDQNSDNYRATRFQYLFIPGDEIASVAVVHDQNQDDRVTDVGELIFTQPQEERSNA